MLAALEDTRALMASDPEMAEMAAEEAASLGAQAEALEKQLTVAILPRDPLDDRNIMLEIRAGTGGEEAGLWCSDLLRMYTRYAESVPEWKARAGGRRRRGRPEGPAGGGGGAHLGGRRRG